VAPPTLRVSVSTFDHDLAIALEFRAVLGLLAGVKVVVPGEPAVSKGTDTGERLGPVQARRIGNKGPAGQANVGEERRGLEPDDVTRLSERSSIDGGTLAPPNTLQKIGHGAVSVIDHVYACIR
jgi:hypothetical protein